MLHLAGLARLDHDAAPRPRTFLHQVVVHAPGGQQHRHRGLVTADAAIGEQDDRRAVTHGTGGFVADGVEPLPHASHPVCGRKEQRDDHRLEARHLRAAGRAERLDPGAFSVGNDRRFQTEETALLRLRVEEVSLAADRRDHRRDDLLADGVERRIGHLREELLEIVGEQLRSVGEHGQRRIVAHRTDRFGTVGGHRGEDHLQVFEGVAVGPLQFEQA